MILHILFSDEKLIILKAAKVRCYDASSYMIGREFGNRFANH